MALLTAAQCASFIPAPKHGSTCPDLAAVLITFSRNAYITWARARGTDDHVNAFHDASRAKPGRVR